VALDALALVQFADRIGLNLAALLTIGFALHSATGIVDRDGGSRIRSLIFAAIGSLIVFAVARLLLLVGQMGDGANLIDPELLPLAWMALGPSTTLLIVGALSAAAGLLWGSRALAGLGALAIASGFGLNGHTQGVVAWSFTRSRHTACVDCGLLDHGARDAFSSRGLHRQRNRRSIEAF
jgi:hypothetical protein